MEAKFIKHGYDTALFTLYWGKKVRKDGTGHR